jgi:hypothetical protein
MMTLSKGMPGSMSSGAIQPLMPLRSRIRARCRAASICDECWLMKATGLR